MPLSTGEEKQVTGEGYYASSVFSARSLLENIAGEIDNGYYLEAERPSPYGHDIKVFKVTITVEEV